MKIYESFQLHCTVASIIMAQGEQNHLDSRYKLHSYLSNYIYFVKMNTNNNLAREKIAFIVYKIMYGLSLFRTV